MNMRWRHCIPYAAILSKRNSKASQLSSSINQRNTMNAKHISAPNPTSTNNLHSPNNTMDVDEDQSSTIGGGAINEKRRYYQQANNGASADSGGDTKAISSNSWNPTDNLSHMLHALVGLDRYPNYLNRFRDISDLTVLEEALESKLSDVRQQKSDIIKRRAGIQQLVKRYILSLDEVGTNIDTVDSEDLGDEDSSTLWDKHPLLSRPKTWSELRERKMLHDQAFKVAFQSSSNKRQKARGRGSQKDTDRETRISPTIEDIIDGKVRFDLSASLLEDLMSQEMFDVYSFPLLKNEFCRLLRETLRGLSTLAESDEFSHLQLGRRPIDLDTIGLGWITDLLFHMFIQPISRHLFATTEIFNSNDAAGRSDSSTILDWRQGYCAGYSASPTGRKAATRHRLVPHTDDAEVTLNCCLGEETFVGGNVEFYGLRGTPKEGELVGKVQRPNVGTALLHAGRHLHAVSDVSAGDRYALIVWSRSWGHLRSSTCPCCWLNRRQDTTCICDKRWN